METFVFYLFSTFMVMSALMVITVHNPVRAAFFLVLTFFASAAVWLLLEAEFLAVILIIVYVGAVMVLFLFVVMMLDINLAPLREGFIRYLPVGAGVAILMVIAMGLVVGSGQLNLEQAAIVQHGPGYNNTAELGEALYTNYLYPFEIAGAILLVAIVAAISLTMRKPRSHKAQKPEQQVAVKREDRVRLVKMKSEKK